MTQRDDFKVVVNVPEPDDENTVTLVEFRAKMAHSINIAEYAKGITYLKRASKTNSSSRLVAAVVPLELVEEYKRLTAEQPPADDTTDAPAAEDTGEADDASPKAASA